MPMPDTTNRLKKFRVALLSRSGATYRRWATRRHDDSLDGAIDAARDLMRSKQNCIVITLDAGGAPAARVVQPWRPDAEWVIRFGTDPNSRKARDIARTGRCLLVYADDARSRSVSVSCRATLVTDLASKRRWFMPFWTAFWPAGAESAGFVVVECVAETLELWDGRAVVAPEPFGRKSQHLVRSDDGWEITPA